LKERQQHKKSFAVWLLGIPIWKS